MPATIKNLTEDRISVPIVDYLLDRREIKYFEFAEYDKLYNDPTIRHLLDIEVIELVSGAVGTVPPHAPTHENGGTDVVDHQNLQGAGTQTHAQLDAHVADTNNPHQTSISNIEPGTLQELSDAVTDADLTGFGALLFQEYLAAQENGAYALFSYTGSALTQKDLWDGAVMAASAGRTLTFNNNSPANDTIVASSGDFTTDGFTAGKDLSVFGTTSNDGAYTVQTVTATVITLNAAGVLTNEGPASSGEQLQELDTQLFSKSFTYADGNLIKSVLTRISDSVTATKLFAYLGSALVRTTILED